VPPSWVAAIAAYFDLAAEAYADAIEPAYGQPAKIAVTSLRLQAGERLLDLGVGTGLGARAAQQYGARVAGVDLAPGMLRIARQRGVQELIQADIHQLPFQANAFDAVLAVFALNSTDPKSVLAEAHRVLRPGGRIAAAEWHERDNLSEIFSDIFLEYCVDDPPAPLAQLREQLEQPIPWDELETVEELQTLVGKAGFERIRLDYVSPRIVLPDINAFVRFKMAWPIRVAEFAAMPPEVQKLCMSDIRENIAPHTDAAGQVIWEPNILVLSAVKLT
jgi:ubiquinone/menaquinone biosynthesis C-methylase UbiE